MTASAADNDKVISGAIEQRRQRGRDIPGPVLSVDALVVAEAVDDESGLVLDLDQNIHQAGILRVDGQKTIVELDGRGVCRSFCRRKRWRRGHGRRSHGGRFRFGMVMMVHRVMHRRLRC